MAEGELPERPGGSLTTEQHGLRKEGERPNPFAKFLVGETPPYSRNVYDKVHMKLLNMMDDYPSEEWYWTQLGREDKDDMKMMVEGFEAVAYDHLSGWKKASIQDRYYEAATGDSEGDYPLLSPEDFTENRRVYRDRFELTYKQARAVQKIMGYVQENYDPGGAEPTPENLAKRTFYYDTYLGRPIPKDYPEEPETLVAKPEHEREIAEYLRAKKTPPQRRVKPLLKKRGRFG
jgi:hypothetical protein